MSAKMSTPYALAAGLAFGRAGLAEFSEEAVRRPDVLALTEKVKVVENEEFSRDFPARQTARVTIRTPEKTVSARVDFPKGEPENPMSEEEFNDRYFGLMRDAGVSGARAEAIRQCVLRDRRPADWIAADTEEA
jgi:2-methylcitrate dehydratase PrpD